MRRIIRWGVVLLALAGCAMYVYTGLTSGDEMLPWLNGWMAAPIIAVTIVPIVFQLTSGPGRARFAQGELALGTLTGMRRTGLTVNDQPQMDLDFDVDTASGQRFRGTARQIVDLAQLAQLVPGTVLPVRYLPDANDGRIGIDTDADEAEVQALLYRVQLAKGKITPQQVRIAQEGVAAQAVVMEMRPTGEVRDGDAVIDLLLRVTRPDGTVFDARVQKALAPVALPGVQPGSVVTAKYLPENEQDVSIGVRVA